MRRYFDPLLRWALVFVVLMCTYAGYSFSAEARDPSQVRLFRKANPCPATGSTSGACPGYVVDHAYPLCAGGLDIPANMIWQDTKASYIKDRIERELCACKKGK